MSHEEQIAAVSAVDGELEMAGIRITDEQIDGWRRRLSQIDANLLELTEEKTRLQRKLAAVAELEDGNREPILDDTTSPPSVIIPAASDEGIRLIDAIPLVVRKFKRPMTPKQIKKRLPEVGFSQSFGENYFYTALKRAVEKKEIMRTHDKRYVPIDQDMIGIGINGGSQD